MSGPAVEHTTFVIARSFEAPPEKVFAAFADPAIRERWFVKAEGWPLTEFAYDFRVGGREHGRFSQDGETIITNETVYLDIVPGRRIVSAYAMALEGLPPFSASLATTTFEPDGDGTRLVYTEQGAFLDGKDTAAQRESGCRFLFDKLGQELARPTANG